MSTNNNVQRKLLYVSVGCICKDVGFQGASKAGLETLTEMLQAFMSELTRSCRKFCEHGHRTTPDLTDIKMALSEFGLSAHGINLYSKQVKNQQLRINPSKQPTEHKILKSSLPNLKPPSYIPNHFPLYPDVHSFVRTPVLREPANQYEIVRERIATQKMATEDSLVRFYAKTNPADVPIFEEMDSDDYPLAKVVMNPQSYLQALLFVVDKSNHSTTHSKIPDDVKIGESDTDTLMTTQVKTEAEGDLASLGQQATTVTPNDVTSPSQQQQNPFCKPPKRIRYKK